MLFFCGYIVKALSHKIINKYVDMLVQYNFFTIAGEPEF